MTELEIKDKVSVHSGNHQGIEFHIETVLLADGKYCSTLRVGTKEDFTHSYTSAEIAEQAGLQKAVDLILEATNGA